MSRERDSPIQVQSVVGLFRSTHGSDYPRDNRNEGRQPAGRRRVFVQTETGCVLGMELDRGDNVHTVKRRLQVALNVPTDESSLTFGDMVLKNDLSAVRNDSPLLLTRNNLHRSSSTPCLSPTGREIQPRDKSGPIEILGRSSRFDKTKPLVRDIVKATRMGVDPIPVNGGLGEAYFFRNARSKAKMSLRPSARTEVRRNRYKVAVDAEEGRWRREDGMLEIRENHREESLLKKRREGLQAAQLRQQLSSNLYSSAIEKKVMVVEEIDASVD